MRKLTGTRKLLIASVGVATINYVAACGGEASTSGNLIAPPAGGSAQGGEAGAAQAGTLNGFAGNVVTPPAAGSGGASTGGSSGVTGLAGMGQGDSAGRAGASQAGGGAFTSGNLLPPPIAGSSGSSGSSGAGNDPGGTAGQ